MHFFIKIIWPNPLIQSLGQGQKSHLGQNAHPYPIMNNINILKSISILKTNIECKK